jgi:hypothetical protein
VKKSIGFALLCLVGCGGGGGGKGDMAVVEDMTMGGKDLRVVRDMTQINCDPNAQDCVDPAKKCTEVAIDQMMTMLEGQCIAITGNKMPGDPCTRTPDVAGHDDCDKGSFCSSIGSYYPLTMPNRHCRSYCASDGDCKTMGERCDSLDPQNGVGLCVPTCTPFGTDCQMGYDCSMFVETIDQMALLATCRFIGMTAIGAACKDVTDCVAGATCNIPQNMTMGTCVAMCDMAHPCPNAGKCMAAPGLPNGGGTCG